MSNHLSQDQLAQCFIGRRTSAELQHILECSECSAELERFGATLSLFRSAIKDRIHERLALQTSAVTEPSFNHAGGGISKWRWAFGAAAVVVFGTLPFFVTESRPTANHGQVSIESSPDAIMDAMNRHLSRVVPAPMEPMMSLIPNDYLVKLGGIR